LTNVSKGSKILFIDMTMKSPSVPTGREGDFFYYNNEEEVR